MVAFSAKQEVSEKNDFAVVRRPSSAVEKAAPGAKRILSGMVAETLAVARKTDALRREEAEGWFQKGRQLWQKAGELFDTVREVVVRLHKAAESAEGQESVECFQRAADLGHAAAQEQLGMLYNNGEGVPENYRTAFHWYFMAANQGYARAQNAVADCYRAGLGVERDYAKAVEWYCKAGDNGYTHAYSTLASWYEKGDGVPQDFEEALRWLTKSAEAGNSGAALLLGWRYQLGKNVPRDNAQAAKWLRIAAEHGDSKAAHGLGLLFLAGRGVELNEAEAVNWCRRAAQKDYAPAQCQLGKLYLEGRGLNRDVAEAAAWFHAAADQGDVEACELFGLCYERGWGLPLDFAEAFVWYSLAADGSRVETGSVSAKRKANRLVKKLTPEEHHRAKARYQDHKALDQLEDSDQNWQVGRCPLCANWIVEPSSYYVCRRRGCKFRVLRLVNHHRITQNEMRELLTNGHTGLLADCISKSGVRFSSRLLFDRNSGHVAVERVPAD